MINSVRPYALTLGAGALAALLFAVPFAFGIVAAAPLTLTGIPLMAAGLGIGVIAAASADLTGLVVITGIVLALALGPEPSILFALLFAAPIVFAVHMLRRAGTANAAYGRPPDPALGAGRFHCGIAGRLGGRRQLRLSRSKRGDCHFRSDVPRGGGHVSCDRTAHAYHQRNPCRFYGFLIVLPPLSVPVALIGVADQILGLRRRTGLVRSGQEV